MNPNNQKTELSEIENLNEKRGICSPHVISLEDLSIKKEDIDTKSSKLVEKKHTELRAEQRRHNRIIGNGEDIDIPIAEKITLKEAQERFVYINSGSRVADLNNPSRELTLKEFHNCYISSKHFIENKSVDTKGNEKSTKTSKQVTQEWFSTASRLQVDTRTFAAGEGLLVNDPDGRPALNLWSGFRVHSPISDSEIKLADYFINHCHYIFEASADKFLDWLAHIQQKPGELPHYGWISIATNTGVGRNWISSVLTRVFAGYVAASLDLTLMLETQFNGELSKKLLAIVDEIQEGGNGQWKFAQKLKSIVTQERRTINPKFAQMRVEFNSCRWLMFSNHLNAVPLDESDRRFEVVITKNKPRDEEYYSELYELLKNPAFISAVAQTLATRDITNFNPGARPEMSASKKLMIEESKSEAQKLADEIVKFWPYDVITLEDIYAYLKTTHGDKAVRPVCEQAGMQNISNPIRVFGDKRRCKILRNYEQWQSATTAELIEELEKRHPKLSAEEVVMRSIEKLQA